MLIALPVVSGNSYPVTFICLDHSFSGNTVLHLSFPLVFHPLHKMLVTSELQVIMVLNKKKLSGKTGSHVPSSFEEFLETEEEANERWHILCEREQLPVLLLPSSLST